MRYEQFVSEVQRRAFLNGTVEAEQAIGATLQTLAERVGRQQASALARQLPPPLAEYLLPIPYSGRPFALSHFFLRVAAQDGSGSLPDAIHCTRVIIAILALTISADTLEDVWAELSPDYDSLLC